MSRGRSVEGLSLPAHRGHARGVSTPLPSRLWAWVAGNRERNAKHVSNSNPIDRSPKGLEWEAAEVFNL